MLLIYMKIFSDYINNFAQFPTGFPYLQDLGFPVSPHAL